MSDPVSQTIQAIDLGINAVKAGATIATAVAAWWGVRQSSREESSSDGVRGFYRQKPEDLLYVMATIGQWMFSLEAINFADLAAARAATRQAFTVGDPDDDDIGYLFEHMDDMVQYAVTAGMAFCAECWPMHIWKGFGCGVFNELSWADPNNSNIFCLELDNSIAALKSQPHQWKLFKKSPSAISKTDPVTLPIDKSAAKKLASVLKDIFQKYEKEGFPQPLPPYDHIKITQWWIPFATWNGSSMYESEFHRTEAVSRYQCDPGRFLWAWTVGKHAQLRPGEALILAGDHIEALAQWMEGLKGITFRVLLDNEVDYGKVQYKRSTRKLLKRLKGNEQGVSGDALCMVYDPQLDVLQNEPQQTIADSNLFQTNGTTMEKPAISSMEPPQYSETPLSPLSGSISFPSLLSKSTSESSTAPASPATKRRAVPLPPTVAVKKVIGTHDFSAESEEELSFSKGDVLEVLDDKSDDGWWKARLGGKTGLIPKTFITDVIKEEQSPVEETPITPIALKDLETVESPTSVVEDFTPKKHEIAGINKRNSMITRKPVGSSQVNELKSNENLEIPSPKESIPELDSLPLPTAIPSSPVVAIPTPIVIQPEEKKINIPIIVQKIVKPPQKKRDILHLKVHEPKSSKLTWSVDIPVSEEIYEEVAQTDHDFEHIKYTAMTFDLSDMLKFSNFTNRDGNPEPEILIGVDLSMKTDAKDFVSKAAITIGSVMDEISSASSSKQFGDRCGEDPWKHIVLCLITNRDGEKNLSFLRNMGVTYLWDVPGVYLPGKKKKDPGAFYDDGRKNPRKLNGEKVKIVFNEYTTTYRIKNWQNTQFSGPLVVPQCDPIRTLAVFDERWWPNDADKFLKPIAKMLNARFLITMEAGARVTPGSIFKQWQMYKNDQRPKETGGDATCESYLG